MGFGENLITKSILLKERMRKREEEANYEGHKNFEASMSKDHLCQDRYVE